MERVTAITVTYNRTDTLKRCIMALQGQSRIVDDIIIVDNNSNSEEKQRLKKMVEGYNNIHILWNQENLGGAGGFEAGMAEARKNYPSDCYWLMDDDAYPRKDCLKYLLSAFQEIPEAGFVAPLIYGIDLGEYQLYHHKYLSKLILKNIPIAENYEDVEEITQIDANAFVGPLISKKAVDKVGIADGSLFIYGDDTEYTFRISRQMRGYLIKKAVIDHQDPPQSVNCLDPKAWWKQYYCDRNQYFMIREFQGGIIKRCIAYGVLTLRLVAVSLTNSKYRGGRCLRIKLLARSFFDGISNRRGKTLDPVKYSRSFK